MSTRKVVRARDVMHTEFQTIDGLMTVADAIANLKRTHATAQIVSKRSEDDEYGILLLSGIAKQVIALDREPTRVNVYEVMSKPVISVPPEMEIRYCARLFDRFGLSVAPVVDAGEVVGIVDYASMVLDGLLAED